mmetsp:Transcript_37500/g.73805  ORF Transcript_37500/g.73805 Transcript_37500/m.73805 type:complete len:738 (+) Transcript_37500:705-2918(+)
MNALFLFVVGVVAQKPDPFLLDTYFGDGVTGQSEPLPGESLGELSSVDPSCAASRLHPNFVSIRDSEGSHMCSGVLVAAEWVLTSGFCPASRVSVSVIGANIRAADNCAEVIPIKDSVVHESYQKPTGWKGVFENDLQLFELARPATYFPTAVYSGSIEPSTPIVLLGFKSKARESERAVNLTRELAITISATACTSRRGQGFAEVPETAMCAFPENGGGGCLGDLGSPAFVQTAGGLELVGITSPGTRCQPNEPALLSRFSSFTDWLCKASKSSACFGVDESLLASISLSVGGEAVPIFTPSLSFPTPQTPSPTALPTPVPTPPTLSPTAVPTIPTVFPTSIPTSSNQELLLPLASSTPSESSSFTLEKTFLVKQICRETCGSCQDGFVCKDEELIIPGATCKSIAADLTCDGCLYGCIGGVPDTETNVFTTANPDVVSGVSTEVITPDLIPEGIDPDLIPPGGGAISTFSPSALPTTAPTVRPTDSPTPWPTFFFTAIPTAAPSAPTAPSAPSAPTYSPTVPSRAPTHQPTNPTFAPSLFPTNSPTNNPTAPTNLPTPQPPTPAPPPPTPYPSFSPTVSRSPTTVVPTFSPTVLPTSMPTSTPPPTTPPPTPRCSAPTYLIFNEATKLCITSGKAPQKCSDNGSVNPDQLVVITPSGSNGTVTLTNANGQCLNKFAKFVKCNKNTVTALEDVSGGAVQLVFGKRCANMNRKTKKVRLQKCFPKRKTQHFRVIPSW